MGSTIFGVVSENKECQIGIHGQESAKISDRLNVLTAQHLKGKISVMHLSISMRCNFMQNEMMGQETISAKLLPESPSKKVTPTRCKQILQHDYTSSTQHRESLNDDRCDGNQVTILTAGVFVHH